VNPDDPRFTTLQPSAGAFDDFGLEKRYFAALIVAYRLYQDEGLLNQVIRRYQVPQPAEAVSAQVPEFGPEIDWRGPNEQVQLQSWLLPEPDFQDVGFLKRAIDRAGSVCRVEFTHLARRGTGFLVAPDLVLVSCAEKSRRSEANA
jgi:hypothetical protein